MSAEICGAVALINAPDDAAATARARLALMAICARFLPGFLPVSPRQSTDVHTARPWAQDRQDALRSTLATIEGCAQTTISIRARCSAPAHAHGDLRARAKARRNRATTARSQADAVTGMLNDLLQARPIVQVGREITQIHVLAPVNATRCLANRLNALGDHREFDGAQVTVSGPWPCLAFHEVPDVC